MVAVLLFTVVLTVGVENLFVTIQRPSTDSEGSDKSLELAVGNGTFTDAFSQDLIGKSKMQIVSPRGDGNYSVKIFFETSRSKDPSGLSRRFYLRSEAPKSDAIGDGNVVQLNEDANMASTFIAKVVRTSSQPSSESESGDRSRGKVQLYILSPSNNGFFMAAKHPSSSIKSLPTLREVDSRGALNFHYRGVIAQIMEC